MRLAPTFLVLAALLAAAAPAARAQAPDPRPNILFVMTDDQTVESLRVMSKVRGGLGGQGTSFTRAIATYPLCCPSRATYLTGQYSHNHRVIHNAGPFGGYIHLDNTNTLPVWLQRAGYRTIHVGRYLNGYGVQNPDRAEIPPGWEDWNSTVDPSTFNFTRWTMNENGRLFEAGASGEFQTDFLGRRASEEIVQAAADPRPFFLSLTFPAPHSGAPIDPDDPPSLRTPSPAPRHRDVFRGARLPQGPNFGRADRSTKPQIVADRRRFTAEDVAAIQENYQQELESLLSVDDAVGRLLNTLQSTGELANTLIIYTSDNGFFHGEHGVRSEKVLPYEPGIRIPLIMRGPGVPVARRQGQLVGNVDLAPTILDAARAAPGRVQDGRSLFTLLRDRTLELGREFVLENGRGVNSVPQYRALRNNRFLYVRHDSTGEFELYDLVKDRYQMRNLEDSDRHAGIRRALARRLRVLQRCRGRACFRSRPSVRVAAREIKPKKKAKRRRTRKNQTCLARDVRLSLFGRDGRRVASVRYSVGSRRLGTSRRRPFRVSVKRRRLSAGRQLTIRARVATIDGRVATVDRKITTCAR